MSRSRNARRGTRAAQQDRPAFGEELRARLGGPTASVARAEQSSADAVKVGSWRDPPVEASDFSRGWR